MAWWTSLPPLARALGTSDRMLLYYFGTKERMVAEALALDERRPLLRTRSLLGVVDAPRDPAWARGFMEEVWQQFADPTCAPRSPISRSWSPVCSTPTDTDPSCATRSPSGRACFTSVFRDMGLPEARARTEAVLLVDACFGLLVAPVVEQGLGRGRRSLPRPPRPPRTRLANHVANAAPLGETPWVTPWATPWATSREGTCEPVRWE